MKKVNYSDRPFGGDSPHGLQCDADGDNEFVVLPARRHNGTHPEQDHRVLRCEQAIVARLLWC